MLNQRHPQPLEEKNFRVNDHFPKEIETKRKALYGVMKKAKRDPNNKVRLVRDKLFINDVQYIPENSENRNKADESNQNQRKRIGEGPYRQHGNSPIGIIKAEHFIKVEHGAISGQETPYRTVTISLFQTHSVIYHQLTQRGRHRRTQPRSKQEKRK